MKVIPPIPVYQNPALTLIWGNSSTPISTFAPFTYFNMEPLEVN